MFDRITKEDSSTIKNELSGLLDYSLKETKKFIKEFIEKVESTRAY